MSCMQCCCNEAELYFTVSLLCVSALLMLLLHISGTPDKTQRSCARIVAPPCPSAEHFSSHWSSDAGMPGPRLPLLFNFWAISTLTKDNFFWVAGKFPNRINGRSTEKMSGAGGISVYTSLPVYNLAEPLTMEIPEEEKCLNKTYFYVASKGTCKTFPKSFAILQTCGRSMLPTVVTVTKDA